MFGKTKSNIRLKSKRIYENNPGNVSNHYSLMDPDRRNECCKAFDVEYQDEYGNVIGNPEKVQPDQRKRLRDCLDDCSRRLGLKPSEVLFFMENSDTLLPDNSDINSLRGRQIIAHARKGMARITSSVNSLLFSLIRGNLSSLAHSRSDCKDFELKTQENPPANQSILFNEASNQPTCSKNLSSITLSADRIRRLYSIAIVNRSLFLGRAKDEMLAHLTLVKDEVQKSVPMLELEMHWTSIVHNSDELSKHAYEQQEAIWKFVIMEHRYLRLLKQMNEFCQCFLKMQELGFMRDINLRRVFLNYPELYVHNSKFWKEAVLRMLQTSRNNGTSLDPAILKYGFERMDEWRFRYKSFIYGYADCHNYIQKCEKENILFREFVKWTESQDMLRRQSLLDALTNPMQCLTRYNLLLKVVLKHTIDDNERNTIQDIIARIENATRTIEETLSNNDLQNYLLDKLSKEIGSYEAIDPRIYHTKAN